MIFKKKEHLCEIEFFCNMTNIFVTFDQFNVSFLNKGIHFFKRKKKLERMKGLVSVNSFAETAETVRLPSSGPPVHGQLDAIW